jgi:hypothetical protein
MAQDGVQNENCGNIVFNKGFGKINQTQPQSLLDTPYSGYPFWNINGNSNQISYIESVVSKYNSQNINNEHQIYLN